MNSPKPLTDREIKVLNVFPYDKTELSLDDVMRKVEATNINTANYFDATYKLRDQGLLENTPNGFLSITDSGLDIRKSDSEKSYIFRRLNENMGAIDYRKLALYKFNNSEKKRQSIISELCRQETIRYTSDLMLEFTNLFKEVQVSTFLPILKEKLAKHIDSSVSFRNLLLNLDIPLHLGQLLRYSLIGDDLMVVDKILMNDVLVKGTKKLLADMYPGIINSKPQSIGKSAKLATEVKLTEQPRAVKVQKIEDKHWFDRHVNWIVTLITVIIGASFALGYYFGNNRFDNEKINLKEENMQLKKDTVDNLKRIRELQYRLNSISKKK